MHLGSAFEWASHLSSTSADIVWFGVGAACIFWSAVTGLYFGEKFRKDVGWTVGLISFAMLFYIRQPFLYALKVPDCRPVAAEELGDCMEAPQEDAFEHGHY